MQCPVCSQHTPDAWELLVKLVRPGYQDSITVEPPEVAHEPGHRPLRSFVSVDFMFCANPKCKQLIVRLHETLDVPPHAVSNPETLTWTWLARPRRAVRPINALVPEPFRSDYLEAAAILDTSPRMSAVLSRSILADLLAKYAQLTQYKLSDQVNAFIEDKSRPRSIRENLHYLREIADFGAHTQTNDRAEIIPVERDEAEWTLRVIDDLFEHFIVGPEKDRVIRERFDKKLADAGRNQIQALPEDEVT
jgi:hypothetical protein